MTDVYINGAATVTPTMTTFTFDPTTMNIKLGYMNGVLVTTVAQTNVPKFQAPVHSKYADTLQT